MPKSLLIFFFALASSLFAAPQPAAELPRINGFIVAGHAWTWGKGTLFNAIEKSAEAGCSSLEIFLMGMKISAETGELILDENTPDDVVAKILAKCAEQKVRIINGYIGQKQWTRIGTNEADLRRFFEFGKKLGLTGFTGEPAHHQWDLVEKLVKEYGVTFAIHNHVKGFEAEYFGGPYPYWNPTETALRLNQQNRDARFGICFDTGHAARSGLQIPVVLKTLGKRCLSVHLKDVAEAHPDATDVPYGKGIVPIPEVLAGLAAIPVGHIALEYEWLGSPTFATDIRTLVDYIRTAQIR